MKQLEWISDNDNKNPIIKVPLQFMFPPVQALSKELTKLNSNHQYRISYLGPRWQNSVIFHKKYSDGGKIYQFQEKKVNKNSNFMQDSMSHNEYYRNQIYYRAFEGMNPTLKNGQQLIFQSRFQSGNLDCAVKVDDKQYDIFLRIDSNTRGNIFWFYFSVKNCGNRRVKFNICNLTKASNHFTKGLNPFMWTSKNKQWTQKGFQNVTFQQKRLRYNFLYERMKLRAFYSLSFQIEFKGQQQVKFAYCIPYTYSDLLADVRYVSKVAQIGTLGQSLTGVNIPILMVGTHDKQKNKAVVVITGRIHPGQTNSSLIVSSFMKFLCFSPEASHLRQKIIFIIVPMLNPDGVILGNSRTGASGKDMNRQFRTKNNFLYPEIIAVKNIISKILQTHNIDLYLDFHGHSGKKNMFMFGPCYNITQSLYYKCRVLPKILSTITPIFRYYGCTYDIPYEKRATARAVMLSELNLPIFFTVETSLGFYFDPSVHKILTFDRKKWEEIGGFVGMAFKQYYQDLEQLEQYMESRKKSKKDQSKNYRESNTPSLKTRKSMRQSKKDEKQIKIFKIYQDIKEMEEKKGKTDKKQEDSDASSDSHNSKEQLQKEKLCQFTQMVTQCIKEQKRRVFLSMQKEHPVSHRSKKTIKNKTQTVKTKEKLKQDDFQSFFESQKQKREQIKSQVQNRKKYLEKDIKNDVKRSQIVTHQLRREYFSHQKSKQGQSPSKKQSNESQCSNSQPDILFVERKSKKLNVRMFNFQKVITDLQSFRHISRKKKSTRPIQYSLDKKSTQAQKPEKIPIPMTKVNCYHFHHKSSIRPESPDRNEQTFLNQTDFIGQSSTSQLKVHQKIKFPPSYYKIRYQNMKKRKNDEKKNLGFQEHSQFIRINQMIKSQRKSGTQIPTYQSKKSARQTNTQKETQKGEYAQIKQFPIL